MANMKTAKHNRRVQSVSPALYTDTAKNTVTAHRLQRYTNDLHKHDLYKQKPNQCTCGLRPMVIDPSLSAEATDLHSRILMHNPAPNCSATMSRALWNSHNFDFTK